MEKLRQLLGHYVTHMRNTADMGLILGHFHSIENIIMGCKVSVRNIMRKTAFHTDSMDASLLYDSISFQKDTYT